MNYDTYTQPNLKNSDVDGDGTASTGKIKTRNKIQFDNYI